jgi:hypothetical protein
MCYSPAQAADGAFNQVLHPQYVWTQAQMSSAVRRFYDTHIDHLTILAINALRLFEVPVVSGMPEHSAWVDRTRNRELAIYLACTPTPVPSSRRFHQLDIVSMGVEEWTTPEDDGNSFTFFMCIALVTPEVDGHREQVGTNWRYHVLLSPAQVGLLEDGPIGVLVALQRLHRSIVDSRSI